MKTVLKKVHSYYNPMSINGITFEKIHIVDKGEILHTLKWFNKTINSGNSTDEGIYFHGSELKRSNLSKYPLRYQGTKGDYTLYIDISILPIEQVAVREVEYPMNRYKDTYFRVQGLEAYFCDREILPKSDKQKAYEELYNLLDNQGLSISDLKRYIEFYNNNKELCINSGVF